MKRLPRLVRSVTLRLVLDTNVILSGFMSPHGPPATLLDAVRQGRSQLVTSPAQLAEIEDVMRRPKLQRFLRPGAADDFADLLHAAAELITGPLPTLTDSPDPDDNLILATAVAGRATLIVSGDKKHMLTLGSVRGIFIVTAAEAVTKIGRPR